MVLFSAENIDGTMTSPTQHDSNYIITSILLVVVTSLYFAWRFFHDNLLLMLKKKPFPDLPMPPGNHWFFGHMRFVDGDYTDHHKHLSQNHADENGRTGFWTIHVRTMSFLHWEDVKTVLNAESHRLSASFLSRHFIKSFGEKLIVFLNGKEWKLNRSFVHRAFGTSNVTRYSQIIVDTANTFVSSMKQKIQTKEEEEKGGVCGLEMDIQPLMKMITIDVFGKSAMSYNLESCERLETSEFAEAFEFLNHDITRRFYHPGNLANTVYSIPSEKNREHAKQSNVARSLVAKVIEKRRRVAAGQKYNDMLSDLLEKADGDDITDELKISNKLLEDLLMGLVLAGYDTTSISLTYALYLLSQHPEAEENCVKEIRRLGETTIVKHLVYCRAVMMEALRLYPPAPTTSRSIQKQIKLSDGFVIPEGAYVLVPIHIIHRDERNFALPEEFRPDRWAKYDESTKRWVERDYEAAAEETQKREEEKEGESTLIPAGNPQAFFAFSAGGRNCPGTKFAMQDAVLTLAVLLQHLRFKAVPGYELHPMRKGAVQQPKGGMPMIIERRMPESNM